MIKKFSKYYKQIKNDKKIFKYLQIKYNNTQKKTHAFA